MKTTSNDSGADETEHLFNEKYRDTNGKLLWDKLKEDVARTWNPFSFQELLRRLHEERKKKKDSDDAAP